MSLSAISLDNSNNNLPLQGQEEFKNAATANKAQKVWQDQDQSILLFDESGSSSETEEVQPKAVQSNSSSDKTLDQTPQSSDKGRNNIQSADETIDLSDSSEEGVPTAEEPSQFKKIWGKTSLGMKAVDNVLDMGNAGLKLMGQEGVSSVVDKVQTGLHIAMGAKAAEEGKFSLDIPKVTAGTYTEKYSVGKSMAFVGTCISATAQVAGAAATALSGGTGNLAAAGTVLTDYTAPMASKGVKDPALLYSYYTGYQKAKDLPENTPEEKYEKQVTQTNYLLKGAIKTVKLVTTGIGIVAPMLGASKFVMVPLAIGSFGAGLADAYLTYRDSQKTQTH